MLLKDKRAVITGAGQGIGRAIAKALSAAGARVVVNDINQDAAERVADEIASLDGTAIANTNDISSMAGAEALIDQCVHAFGGIDILVNNAGILRDRMSFNLEESDWDAVLNVCLKGAFACTKFTARQMRAQGTGGRIINVTSRAGLRGNVGQANYAAAKAGILGFTKTVALELRKSDVTVNAICPRADTGMTATIPETVKAEKDKGWAGGTIRERGTADDVAPLVVFLALDDSSWITGQVVGIGGDKLSMWSNPQEIAEAYSIGGWKVEDIRSVFNQSVGKNLQSIGING